MQRISMLLAATALVAGPACYGQIIGGGDDVPTDPTGEPAEDEWDRELGKRQYDYGGALRNAALRLTGELPTLAEVDAVGKAAGLDAQRAAYEALVTDYLARPAFAREMFHFWRDTFRMGGTPELDAAPALAAMLTVENGSYMELFTRASGACPTFDAAANTFAPADCPGSGPKAGVLANPGVMRHFFGNLAFQRAKWVQETFDCAKYPVEIGHAPRDVGGPTPFTGAWDHTSIAGFANGGRIDFLDVSTVICANCHQTLNHLAPLFAYFDATGAYQQTMAVPTPLEGALPAVPSDFLPPGEGTAWRRGVPAADLPALGAAMAADPGVAACGVARIWNFAMGKADIVDALYEVPTEVIQAQLAAFTAGGFRLKDLVRDVFTADDFVKF